MLPSWLDPTDPYGPGLSIWTGVVLGFCCLLAGWLFSVLVVG